MRLNLPPPKPEPVDPDCEARVARILARAQDRRERRKAKNKPKLFQIDLREVIELQRRANEAHNILAEQMERGSLVPERDRRAMGITEEDERI